MGAQFAEAIENLTQQDSDGVPHNVESLEHYAETLASGHSVTTKSNRGPALLPRLKENEQQLMAANQLLLEVIHSGRKIPPAGEWLVDNFHVVEDQLREIREDLPNTFYHELPKLPGGEFGGYPRIYAIAVALTAQHDTELKPETIRSFVRAYQRVTPLTIGELWALPITLRVALLEKLQQLARQIDVVLPSMVGNVITSMRLISTCNWRKFFESVSLVDPILGQDPTGAYWGMDFASRDQYRHSIERISRNTKTSETDIAKLCVRLAEQAQFENPKDLARAHVGYYLVGEGVYELEKAFAYAAPVPERLRRVVLRHPTLVYLGLLALLTTFIVASLASYASFSGAGWTMLLVIVALTIIPVSDLALNVLNWALTHLLKPRLLPRVDTAAGIPSGARTMVVVPTLLSSEKAVDELLEKLEVSYLANQDEEIYFALLGDFSDADAPNTPDDLPILERAVRGVGNLNARYPAGVVERFHLFHRRRQWNASEGRWMGWERKRGKLHEFNRLLRGASDTSFTFTQANAEFLSSVRYVLTLDRDTVLPRDAVRRLVGIALHPLNRPVYDANAGRVTKGYGILQPHIGVTLESSCRSLFASIFCSYSGLDAYTTTSDVYQDIFEEGNHTGKALYDVDIFETALAGCVPENMILSHDLFEGLHARCAFVTDIELLDEFPAQYDSYAKRQHRWVRGDWQIARWILPRVPAAEGRRLHNSLPLISRWKVLDNLRRSLVAQGIFLWLLAAWAFLPGSPLVWTLFVLFSLMFNVVGPLTASLVRIPRHGSFSMHLRNVFGDARTNILQSLVVIISLAHQAYLRTDAIIRTLYRRHVSHRHLLEWQTSAQVEQNQAQGLASMFRFMWPALLLSCVSGGFLLLVRPEALLVAAPFLLAWLLSPFIMFRANRPPVVQTERLTRAQALEARLIARRTWSFFETYVGADDHWLPPDNVRVDSECVIQHRTSPTDIGLLLLSTVAACDFGYMGLLELVERLEHTLKTLANLQKFRGHFFNWYDTRTLDVFTPRYISTVDSGNLAGHLLAVKEGCLELLRVPLFTERTLAGITDSFAILRDEARKLSVAHQRTKRKPACDLIAAVDDCMQAIPTNSPTTWSGWRLLIETLEDRGCFIDELLQGLATEHGVQHFSEARFWVKAIRRQLTECAHELQLIGPPSFLLTATVDGRISDSTVATLWRELQHQLEQVGSVMQMKEVYDAAHPQLALLAEELEKATLNPFSSTDVRMWTSIIADRAKLVGQLQSRLIRIAQRCETIFAEMDFKFLLDEDRKLFHVGYDTTTGRADTVHYDLFASESRLASFVAIAKSDAPQEHWFQLGRKFTSVAGSPALISWGASMFEYLMPLLVMRNYAGTMLDQTMRAAVDCQIEYGLERGVPWGISESAFSARDRQRNYHYCGFGVPGLGLKRGLSEDLVVAPYATMLAAMIAPRRALANLDHLEREDTLSRYGFYESIDYTPQRLSECQRHAIVRAYMAHHQGMALVALDNLLNNNEMQRRFHSDLRIRATEMLLQERRPDDVAVVKPQAAELVYRRTARPIGNRMESISTTDLARPSAQILSNGQYSVMVTNTGAGYSRFGDLAVTRWREDVTRDNHGSFFYLRDSTTGEVWSAGYQPTLQWPDFYEVVFSEAKIEIERRDCGIHTRMEVILASEESAEIRRITVINDSEDVREIEITSYVEIVLNEQSEDLSHRAFNSLLIEMEFVSDKSALLARRRSQGGQMPAWAFHSVGIEGDDESPIQFETHRERFLGRGRTPVNPIAVMEGKPLSNTLGVMLDPVFCLRKCVRLEPRQTARVLFTTGIAASREEAVRFVAQFHDSIIFEREEREALARPQARMHRYNGDAEEDHLFRRLGKRVIDGDWSLRQWALSVPPVESAPLGLRRYGISGDLPILLLCVNHATHLDMARQMLRAHEYLHMKQPAFDLVILNEGSVSGEQTLQEELENEIRALAPQFLRDKRGAVYLQRADVMPEADRKLLRKMAQVLIVAERGSLADQLLPPDFVAMRPPRLYPQPVLSLPELTFINGLGGFHDDGREYMIMLGEGQWTPAPWTNVISNEHDFGFIVTESGGGYTWSANSRENRLTPWSNDAVSDPPGEIFYIRDEESGSIWTPTPLPIREVEPYVVCHGQGFTKFEHNSHGIAQELLQFVALNAPVKISVLRLRNVSDRSRRISVTNFNELVLGAHRELSAPYIVTKVNPSAGTVLAHNPSNNGFANRTAFVATRERVASMTCDRREFLGRNGSLDRPAALRRVGLGGWDGAGLDPCAAVQTVLELSAGEERELIFLLGQGDDEADALEIIARFTQTDAPQAALDKVQAYWDEILGSVQVRTPDIAMNTIMNRWLLYQTLACRLWARSAFYQPGGAYGFRDQLQDVMALVYSKPQLAREHILRAAEHQFREGDVQHWWHSPTGRGVRTRFSDDLLWLPYVTAFYADKTGDTAILDERVSFLEAPLLEPGQDNAYLQPKVSQESATMYAHCVRALDRSLAVGPHDLPLIGSGDWNDGMNRVGEKGAGESVWVGWFLHNVLEWFAPICSMRGDGKRAEIYRAHMKTLKAALEKHGWDGQWYRRAYFDDGTPLGSAQNEECQIDSVTQSWSVLTGVADPQRAARAMAAVEERLIRREDGLVLLNAPPLDNSRLDPGCVKDYAPGVRQNGGQYTHAAIWTLIAYARLGNGELASELFELLNPINRTATHTGLQRYRVEPYVVAADVHASWPHTGRGGWTWYTASASWMYRAGLEFILGFQLRGDRLYIQPCIPSGWGGYTIKYRHNSTRYHIEVSNPFAVTSGIASLELDGEPQSTDYIPLRDDGSAHEVRILLGPKMSFPHEAYWAEFIRE